MRGTRSDLQHQSAFSEHGLKKQYGPNTMQTQSIGAPAEAHGASPQSHLIGKASEAASPPPHSATTSGSTSTPTSPNTSLPTAVDTTTVHTSAESDLPMQTIGDPSTQLPPLQTRDQIEERWPYSISGRIVPQQDSPSSQVAPPVDEQGLLQPPEEPYNAVTYPSAIKLLVSNNVAGSIIGRAGQTISELQTDSSARIKLSQTGDYYPGTQDRVCLIQGQIENVKIAVRLLLERFYMLQEQQHSQHLAWQPKPNEPVPLGFDFVVRLLVPSASCGMIIGKSGSNIKHMEEASGVSSVRLSPKESGDPPSPSGAMISGTSERIVTLTGPTMDSCLTCLHIILDGMMAHHEICRYSNMTTSYSRVVIQGAFGGVPTGPIPGRPLFMVPSGATQESAMWEGGNLYQFGTAKRSSSSPDLSGQIPWDQRVTSRISQETSTPPLSRPPHPREALQPYGNSFAEGPQSYAHETPPMIPSPARGPPSNANPPPLYLLDQGPISNSFSAPDLVALQQQDTIRINAPPSSGSLEYTHFAPQLPQPTPPGFTAQVLVPDTLIGSILGRGGRTLNELQMHSNTRIRISQRGEYVPGTRNRIVTIRGPTANSVNLAQYLMSQRMVLPPTATYSPPQSFHPATVSQQSTPYQRLPPHPSQQPQQAHRHDFHSQIHHVSSVESSFQGPESSHGQHPSAALSRSGSSKELSHS